MRKALEQAKVNPEEIGYVNAHGTATPINDVVESQAIATVFSNCNVPVNSIKSLVGHCMGAAGAVEAVNCILSLRDNFIPGTKNLDVVDPEICVNVVRESMDSKFNYVLSNSAGFGGNHCSLLFRRGGVS